MHDVETQGPCSVVTPVTFSSQLCQVILDGNIGAAVCDFKLRMGDASRYDRNTDC